ncbi:4Fe-4S binding protein [Candidatus Sumerlaeota bacterium]|nr:4Fe-4S binding protein [Candidatus Sumerlaeota bacterium]
MVRIDESKCQGCGNCVEVCPTQAISLKDGIASIDETRCVECFRCVSACPIGAITPVFEKSTGTPTSLPIAPPAPIDFPHRRARFGGAGAGRRMRRRKRMGWGRRRGFY